MTPLGPAVTGVQPGSIGTVVVVVVGSLVVELLDVVEEIEVRWFGLAPEHEVRSNEVSIETTRAVREERLIGLRCLFLVRAS
jgi:hypothetical protein